MQSTNWAPEHAEALREHLAKGLSYSEIAAAINARFKTDYSRNATIGRARRMGLAGSERPGGWPKLSPKAQQPSLQKIRKRRSLDGVWRVPVFERTETAELRCVEVDPRHLSLIDLEPGDCRYPYGGDEEGEAITFCGHKRREGSSYCAPHFDLTRGPAAVSERVARAVSLKLVEAA
jgi:GcrA cell cycle regulator